MIEIPPSWTTPCQRAERAIQRAGEHMEFKRFVEARAQIAIAIAQLTLLQECATNLQVSEVALDAARLAAKVATQHRAGEPGQG
jgi:hypothetical protein